MDCSEIKIVEQGSAEEHKYDQKHQGLDYGRSEIQGKHIGTAGVGDWARDHERWLNGDSHGSQEQLPPFVFHVFTTHRN